MRDRINTNTSKISNVNFLTKTSQSIHQEMISLIKRFHVFPFYRTMLYVQKNMAVLSPVEALTCLQLLILICWRSFQ